MKKDWGIWIVAALSLLACVLVWRRTRELDGAVRELRANVTEERDRRRTAERALHAAVETMRRESAARAEAEHAQAAREEAGREEAARESAAREEAQRRLEAERRRAAVRRPLEQAVETARVAFEAAQRELVRLERRYVPESQQMQHARAQCDRARARYDAAIATLEEFDRVARAPAEN